MKFSAVICAILASAAAAFSPAVDRRAAFGQIAAGAATVAVAPQLAFADGAVSAATIQRSKGVYGDRIAALKKAVDAGDFAAIADEKNAFILFNSGAYPRVVDKSAKATAIADTNALFAAIRAGDKAAVKKAYEKYVADNDIKPLPAVESKNGQGYSSDFDYRVKTSAAAIYVR
ncbi:hypothetical protein ACA910_004949 [Epithemia clementina (nom. ined.)]